MNLEGNYSAPTQRELDAIEALVRWLEGREA